MDKHIRQHIDKHIRQHIDKHIRQIRNCHVLVLHESVIVSLCHHSDSTPAPSFSSLCRRSFFLPPMNPLSRNTDALASSARAALSQCLAQRAQYKQWRARSVVVRVPESGASEQPDLSVYHSLMEKVRERKRGGKAGEEREKLDRDTRARKSGIEARLIQHLLRLCERHE